ncbi:MAG: T9SS type A sorting domain-containing protein [Chitinophagales bacterium]
MHFKCFIRVTLYLQFVLVFLFHSVHAQTERYGNTEIFTDEQILVMEDLIYGNALNTTGVNQDLLLDLYLPDTLLDTETALPLVVFVHGGSFKGGDKDSYDDYCLEFAKRGYAAATINYRVGWNKGAGCTGDPNDLNRAFYRAVQDTKAALRFLTYYSEQYHIDPDNIFIGGESAGSATILHTAFANNEELKPLTSNVYLTLGSIDSSGNSYPANYTIKGCMNRSGGLFSETLIENEDSIPVISFHGVNDHTVPIDTGAIFGCYQPVFFKEVYGSLNIKNRLDSLDFSYEFNYMPGGDHKDSVYPAGYIINRTSKFFQNILNNIPVQLSQVSAIQCTTTVIPEFSCSEYTASNITLETSYGAEPYYYSTDMINWSELNTYSVQPGDHTFYIKDESGIILSKTVTVEEEVFSIPEITSSGFEESCADVATFLTAPDEAISVEWYLNGNPLGETNDILDATQNGEYSASIEIEQGCFIQTNSININKHIIETPVILFDDNILRCEGDEVLLSLNNSYAAYTWSNGSVSETLTLTASAESGEYSVIVYDSFGCSVESEKVNVVIEKKPVIEIEASVTEVCNGETITIHAPEGFTTYNWNNGCTDPFVIVSAPKWSGDYFVTVTNEAGCSSTSTPIMATVFENPEAKVTTNDALHACAGDVITLNAVGELSFLWSTGEVTTSIEVTEPGEYFVVATDENGCSSKSENLTITIDPLAQVSITAEGLTTFCPGGSVTLTAEYFGNSVQWTRNGYDIPGATNISYVATNSAAYACTVTNDCGKVTSETIYVVVDRISNTNVTASGTLYLCPEQTVTLTAPIVEGYSYQWYKGSYILEGENSATFTTSTAGTYKCLLTTASGCTKYTKQTSVSAYCKEGIDEHEVSVYPNPNTGDFYYSISNGELPESVRITDIAGNTVYASLPDGNNMQNHIELTGAAAGMYFLTIEFEGSMHFEKFVIK